MARFCTSCGSPLGEGLKFCPTCGAQLGSPPTQPASPVSAAVTPRPPVSSTPAMASPSPAAPAKTGSPVLKIVLAVLAFFVVIGLFGIAGVVYVGYRVHRKAQEWRKEFPMAAQGRSPDWPGGSSTSRNPNWDRDVCSLVTKEEVAEAIASPIVESTNDGGMKSKCVYKGPAESYTQVGLEVEWDGGAAEMMAARIASTAIPGNQQLLSKVPGVGDDAFADPLGAMLIVRKGEAAIKVDMRAAPNKLEAAKIIANKALSRM